MATTAPDGLISPDASDPYDLTSDMAAMQASTQAALVNRASKSGSNSQMLSASGVQTGTLWFNTTDNRLYRFNGTGWDSVALSNNSIESLWATSGSVFNFDSGVSSLGGTFISKIGRMVSFTSGIQASGGFSTSTQIGQLSDSALYPWREVVLPAAVNNGSGTFYPGAGVRIATSGALTVHNRTGSSLVGLYFSGAYVANS